MVRELLTKLSKTSHSLSDRLDKLGFIGTFINILLALFLLIGPILLSFWIVEQLFPRFWNYGDESFVHLFVTLCAMVIWGAFYWLLFSPPKDYVATKISDNIYKTLKELNTISRRAAQLGIYIHIRKESVPDYPYFTANITGTSGKETEEISECKIDLLKLIKKLNSELEQAQKHNLQTLIDMRHWGPERMKEAGESEPYRYLFTANISTQITL